MKVWVLDEIAVHNKRNNPEIAEDWTVYFRRGRDAWRIAICRSASTREPELWSRGQVVDHGSTDIEHLWRTATTYYQLTGGTEGFPVQDIDVEK